MFKLAGHLGMTVGELGRRMTGRELSEWIAFDRVEPLPDPHWSAGVVASTVANCMGGGGRSFGPEDFRPAAAPEGPPPGPQTAAEGKARLATYAMMLNPRFD